MLFSEASEAFWQFPKFGEGIGFRRLFLLLEKLTLFPWIEQFPTIKVTGSNGKGSTCAWIAQILQRKGFKVGLFISPHLFRFHERISINNVLITEAQIQHYLKEILSTVKMFPQECFGRFEISVALAMAYFRDQQVDIGVIEVGIGGRFDSTRIFRGPITVLTSLDLEHTDLLGNTLEMIGYEKIDLADPNSDVVLGNLSLEIVQKLEAYGKLNGLRIHPALNEINGEILSESATHLSCSFQHAEFCLPEVTLPVGGNFQRINLQMAILAVFLYLRKKDLWTEGFCAQIPQAFTRLHWEGRFQKISESPRIFIDAGHTGEAMRALRETVKKNFGNAPILLLLGVSFNKNKFAILKEILPVAHEIICTEAHHHGEKVHVLELLIRELTQTPLTCISDLSEALCVAKEKALLRGMTIVVAGSLFLSIEVATLLRGEDPRQLHFF